jgi:hypothetical protein
LVTHKTALQWYERLAGSSGTKIIGQQQRSTAAIGVILAFTGERKFFFN